MNNNHSDPKNQFKDTIKIIENRLYNVYQPENSEAMMQQKLLFQQGVAHISRSFNNVDSLSPMFQRRSYGPNDADYYYYMIEREKNK